MKTFVLSHDDMVMVAKGEVPKGLEDACKLETGDKKYSKFLNNYNGKSLLEKHTLDEEGLWKIEGEPDPSTTPKRAPDLGILSGKLDEVIKVAVHYNLFWSWGNGGDIIKLEIGTV